MLVCMCVCVCVGVREREGEGDGVHVELAELSNNQFFTYAIIRYRAMLHGTNHFMYFYERHDGKGDPSFEAF